MPFGLLCKQCLEGTTPHLAEGVLQVTPLMGKQSCVVMKLKDMLTTTHACFEAGSSLHSTNKQDNA